MRVACAVAALALGCAPVAPPAPSPPRSPPPPVAPIMPTHDEPEARAREADRDAAPPTDADAPDARADGPAPERHPFHEKLPGAALPANAPAARFANLTADACRREASRRKLPVQRDRRPTPGVATAFRLHGPLSGVNVRTAGRKSPYGILDCRLALVFDEMAKVLVEHGVTSVDVGTIYRPGSKLRRRKFSQHHHAIAADVVAFGLADGRKLVIENDWNGAIGEPACGPRARLTESTPEAIALRTLACDLARKRLFHHILTPNFDAAHHDHLHLDIVRNGKRGTIH